MSGYGHLSPAERDRIADLKSAGASLRAIAEALGRVPSTISRALRRKASPRGAYRPQLADGAYLLRRQRAGVLERDTALAGYVTDRLAESWTPEQIAGRLRRGIRPLSTEPIYAFCDRAGLINGDDGPASRSILLSVVGTSPQDADCGGRVAP